DQKHASCAEPRLRLCPLHVDTSGRQRQNMDSLRRDVVTPIFPGHVLACDADGSIASEEREAADLRPIRAEHGHGVEATAAPWVMQGQTAQPDLAGAEGDPGKGVPLRPGRAGTVIRVSEKHSWYA